MVTDIIIPVLNEEEAIGKVLTDIPRNAVRHIIVCDNGSTDNTASVARAAGAMVVSAPERGYGNACLKGMEYIAAQEVKPDVVAFLDGDYSDFPAELVSLIKALEDNQADLVIGARTLGQRENGSLMPQQVFGNWLATRLISWLYGYTFHDLGPFRAITYPALQELCMRDKNYGWTVEMQAKAAKMGMKAIEIPVSYRKRIGRSKVSGTLKGSVLAGVKILWTIFILLRR